MSAEAVPSTVDDSGSRPGRRVPLGRLVALVVLIILAAVPLFVAPFPTSMLGRMLIFGLLAVSLDLLVGITGLPSLGHAAYFGVGAYSAGLVAKYWTAAAPVPLLAAVLVAAIAAAATGWLAVRSHGVFFLMLTLAIGELIQQLAESWSGVTGGDNGLGGIPAVELLGTPLVQEGYVFWYTLAFASVGYLTIWALSRSPFGAALRGIRDNESRMRSLGYSPFRYKLAGFVLAGAVAGLAGGLLATQRFAFVTPADVGFTTSALALLAVAAGGAGSLWGPAIAAALVVLIRDVYGPDLDGHGTLVLGAAFIVAVYLLRNGIAGLATTRFRRRPMRQTEGAAR
ncbi:MAG: branched-chain amino acid ABC transporter permease [Geodermatophilaceae bacterium]|nr:branched-chain amino acid ABC transporter permease [Geodermatophilaceae bacterium]MDQ3476242.1 branched-chain amino acid ABC transporter permease [Actinomycetota bacterium]